MLVSSAALIDLFAGPFSPFFPDKAPQGNDDIGRSMMIESDTGAMVGEISLTEALCHQGPHDGADINRL